MSSKLVTVNSLNFDRTVRRSWTCKLIEHIDERIVLLGGFSHDVRHTDLGLIRKGTVSREYFWLDRWYNIFVFSEPEGVFRNIYCNINLPPTYASNLLEYVDLDIDLLVWPDGSYQLLDQAEFDENATRFNYPPAIRERVLSTVEKLSLMVKDRSIFQEFLEQQI